MILEMVLQNIYLFKFTVLLLSQFRIFNISNIFQVSSSITENNLIGECDWDCVMLLRWILYSFKQKSSHLLAEKWDVTIFACIFLSYQANPLQITWHLFEVFYNSASSDMEVISALLICFILTIPPDFMTIYTISIEKTFITFHKCIR